MLSSGKIPATTRPRSSNYFRRHIVPSSGQSTIRPSTPLTILNGSSKCVVSCGSGACARSHTPGRDMRRRYKTQSTGAKTPLFVTPPPIGKAGCDPQVRWLPWASTLRAERPERIRAERPLLERLLQLLEDPWDAVPERPGQSAVRVAFFDSDDQGMLTFVVHEQTETLRIIDILWRARFLAAGASSRCSAPCAGRASIYDRVLDSGCACRKQCRHGADRSPSRGTSAPAGFHSAKGNCLSVVVVVDVTGHL